MVGPVPGGMIPIRGSETFLQSPSVHDRSIAVRTGHEARGRSRFHERRPYPWCRGKRSVLPTLRGPSTEVNVVGDRGCSNGRDYRGVGLRPKVRPCSPNRLLLSNNGTNYSRNGDEGHETSSERSSFRSSRKPYVLRRTGGWWTFSRSTPAKLLVSPIHVHPGLQRVSDRQYRSYDGGVGCNGVRVLKGFLDGSLWETTVPVKETD